MRDLLPENPWAALVVVVIGVVIGPGAAVWAVLKWRVNGVVSDLSQHITESKAHNGDARQTYQDLRDGLMNNRHDIEMLRQQIKTICPYWDEKTGHHLPPK